MAIKLADTLVPMADFPAVEAKDVAFNDNESLQEKYDNGELGGNSNGEENKINSISVNGSPITIDDNKNVDITVPSIDGLVKDDDLSAVAKSGDYEDLINKPTIPDITGLATETWVNEQGFLTQHQDLSNYATKDEIPVVPSKVSELTNDSDYQTADQVSNIVTTEIAKVIADAPEDFNTLKEMSDWIAGHTNDASAMNSAILDNKTNIDTLQTGISSINTSLDEKLNKTFIGEDVSNKILSTDENGNVVLKDHDSNEGTAETTIYVNENYPNYTNVDLALDALFAKVYYVKPTCSLSASPNGGTFEVGTTISAPITFTWTANKTITSQVLTECSLADENVRTATYNTDITSDKTFTLTVSDSENQASSSVSYKFLNKVYYGSALKPDNYDSAFILGLANKKFATSIKDSYPITVEPEQFGYIACPKSFNAPSECYIGGFLTTLENAGEISFTNASGGIVTYTILKTGKSGLGSLTMEFK